MPRRILFATGGTAGHVRPALAVAAAFRRADLETEIVFAGGTHGVERQLVASHGYRFLEIDSLPIARESLSATLHALRRLAANFRQARALLQDERVELVLGFGGYASAAPVIAARRLGIPTAILECNARPGLANLALLPFARVVFVAFDECRPYLPHPVTIRCGLPLLATARPTPREQRATGTPRLLVTGGTGGSHFLNQQLPPVVAELRRRGVNVDVRHQSGASHLTATESDYRRVGIAATVVPFVDDMSAAYAWADAAVVAAGASTLIELAAFHLPALVVPNADVAWNHQERTAGAFCRAVGLPWATQRAWATDAAATVLERLLTDTSYQSELHRKLAAFDASRGDPARTIVDHCTQLLRLAGPAK